VLQLDPDDAVLGRVMKVGPPIRVELLGQESAPLPRVCDDVTRALADIPDLFDVHSSFEDRRAQVKLVLDRVVAAGLQLSPESIAQQLRQRLGAEAATSFRQGDEERDVVLRAPTQTLASLSALELDSPAGGRVRLGSLARVEVESAPSSIERTLGSRLGVITAQVRPGSSLGDAAGHVEAVLAGIELPAGIRAQVTGAERKRRLSFRQLGFAALLAILLVYMVMASLFESVVHPFTILFTLPTAAVGVVVALALARTGWNVSSLLGTVMLAGIAVNNGILLVDVTGMLREQGMKRREALIAAARMRLRPILMTSLTAILGMLPLAVGIGEGAGMRAPMAVAVAGGLLTSTFLTLFLIPIVYDLLDRVRPGQRA